MDRLCAADQCNEREKLMEDGTCERCPKNMRQKGDGKQCGPDLCESQSRLNEDGYCE